MLVNGQWGKMPPRKSIMVSADLLLELLVQKCRLDDYLNSTTDHIEEAPYDGTHLSDVLEAIKETDPDFVKESPKNQRRVKKSMLNGGGQVVQMPPQQLHQPGVQQSTRNRAEVRIIEQPASKALRFRYECEGRSAGSIPGASSTPENKTFPEIEVVGYKGKAVVVVSCVTKDIPYMVHPHNLVGKEGCKNGVCTVIIPENTMRAQFQNLGIQCVKKRDIESSLRQREQIRVDPFRHGYAHRSQPTSIDLNAVRLCFQVFLENERDGKFTTPLRPVVSDVIYDKKAMSDLTIIKLSDCTSYVDGGRKDIILLCEKVAKEDIEVHFYEKNQQGEEVWHGKADFQPGQVHKQHAIWFRPPRYKTLDISEPVRVFIQLYRPSDQLKSDPLPFELLPLDSGRPNWSFKRQMMADKKANYDLFNSILAHDSKLLSKRQLSQISQIENNNNDVSYAQVHKDVAVDENEIIDQVAELDEIYADTHALVESAHAQSESFDDARTYTSLQLAFKNPVVEEPKSVLIDKPSVLPVLPIDKPSVLPVLPPKRDNNDNSLPPLPPKRSKKIETYIGEKELLTRTPSVKSASQSFTSPVKRLPPVPLSATLPNPKKRGFFAKLFKRNVPPKSRETSLAPSFQSTKSLHVDLSKSTGNISTHSSNSVRIRLKDDSPPVNTVVDEEMQLDLTEAENYALYTAMAPHATQSEFDEFSCYYAPVEGGKLLTNAEVAARFALGKT